MKRKTFIKFIALFIGILFLVAYLSSAIFMSRHAGHECEETTCVVCLQLHTVNSLRKQLVIAMASFLFIGTLLSLFLSILDKNISHLISVSLITLMVRMDH